MDNSALNPFPVPELASSLLPQQPHNVLVFVADGLRNGSVNAQDTPTLYALQNSGVNFTNSHSLFPTFTTPNASAIATGHYLGDTGDFSNTIYAGYPVPPANGSPTPFIENDPILGNLNANYPGTVDPLTGKPSGYDSSDPDSFSLSNFLNEETLLQAARQNGYSTAAVGKLGPTLIQDVSQGTPDPVTGKVPVPQTVIIDDSTGRTGGVPLSADIQQRLITAGVGITTPDRSNGANVSDPTQVQLSNGFSGNNKQPGTLEANYVQQQFFTNAVTNAILPEFKDANNPFAMVYWSRDPDGTQHNQGDSLDSLTPGINGPTSKAAVTNADHNLAQIIQSLKDQGLYDNTDIFVTSDHGFSTISKSVVDAQGTKVNDYAATLTYAGINPGELPPGFVAIDLAHGLGQNLFDPDQATKGADGNYSYKLVDPTQGIRPNNGNGLIASSTTLSTPNATTAPPASVIVAANGGSDLIYIPDHSAATLQQVVDILTKQNYVSGLFVDDSYGPIAGTLPLSSINLKGSAQTPTPAIVVNFKTFSTDPSNPAQSEVEIADTGLQQGQGMHGSFGRGDTFNTMIAAGPDFKQGFSDTAPVSNADVAPTLASIIGLPIPSGNGTLIGRVISEALVGGPDSVATTTGIQKSDEPLNGQITYLNYQQVGDTKYFDAAGFAGGTDGLSTGINGSALGGNKTFVIKQGDKAVISNFGGAGAFWRTSQPLSQTIVETDTLKFEGQGLTASNMILTPMGTDLVVTFDGVSDTQVTLKDFKIENLDNLFASKGGPADLINVLFDSQTKGTDSFDTFVGDVPRTQVFNTNTTTYVDALSTTVSGFDNSNDVIDAPVGDHTLSGGSGDDILRGGAGFNTLKGGDGKDLLEGGLGQTVMNGGGGNDTFVIAPNQGLVKIQDFKLGEDTVSLAGGLTFDQLTVVQGTGENQANALIQDKSGKLLAIVENIQASLLTVAFAPNRTIAGPETATTPQGWFLTPAGKQVQLVDPTTGVYGDRPYDIAISPDGKTMIVSNDGQSTQSLMVVDRATGNIVQTIPYTGNEALYIGVTFSPDGKHVYASAGGNNKIRVYDVAGQQLTEKDPIALPLPLSASGQPVNLYAGGLAIAADGKTLYVADNLGDSMNIIDLESRVVKSTIPVGHNPYTVKLSADGKTAYVSNWGEETVSVIDLTAAQPQQVQEIEVGTHPNAMALNPTNSELYVANADSDNVSVIDTATNTVLRTIDLSPYPGAKEGSSPNALTVSPDGKTLYVANATNNDVAVIKLGNTTTEDEVVGLIPTAWYPTGLVLSPDGKELDVINAKGLGAGPNPNGPIPYRNPEQASNQYVGSMIQGTLSQIDLSDPAMLDQYTQQVIKNNGFEEGSKVRVAGVPQTDVIPLRPGDPSPIKHVIYVIKENRTYDQVLGSLGQGNGDPNLNLFGDESAPNQRALAKQFVTLDNFYADAEVSADGWNWSTGALANTYVQKNWPADYADANRNRPYDFEGGNLATSPGSNPQDAFIWNKLSDAGIDYRNYGFRVFGGKVAANPVTGETTEPRLAANTDLNFSGYNLGYPDASTDLIPGSTTTRIDEWTKEFNQYEANGNLPTMEFVRLPSDHTRGTSIGAPTPRAYMADNDLALGKLVDAVSHSANWKDTAIFVVEDDAQDGPDHVDAHRTVTQIISPYTQTGKVDSTFYSTVSMLRTMELIVGIGPMSQYDAAATPMLNSFTNQPNFSPYSVIQPTQNIAEKNPVDAPLGLAAQSVDWTVEDQNEAIENLMIWQSIKGADSIMPTPITTFPKISASVEGSTAENSVNSPITVI